jgi:hypothetical protein
MSSSSIPIVNWADAGPARHAAHTGRVSLRDFTVPLLPYSRVRDKGLDARPFYSDVGPPGVTVTKGVGLGWTDHSRSCPVEAPGWRRSPDTPTGTSRRLHSRTRRPSARSERRDLHPGIFSRRPKPGPADDHVRDRAKTTNGSSVATTYRYRPTQWFRSSRIETIKTKRRSSSSRGLSSPTASPTR